MCTSRCPREIRGNGNSLRRARTAAAASASIGCDGFLTSSNDGIDPQLGEWQDAVILGRYGDVPDDLAPYTSD